MKVHFSYDVIELTRLTLQIFIDKHNLTEEDKSKVLASNELIYSSFNDDEIENLITEWSKLNDNETVLFKNGLKDAEEMWKLIWKGERFNTILNKYICQGYSGSGVFDKTTNVFIPCNFSQHYDTIKLVLKMYHGDLWVIHRDFTRGKLDDSSKVDDFIMNQLVLIGNRYGQDYYTLNERKY